MALGCLKTKLTPLATLGRSVFTPRLCRSYSTGDVDSGVPYQTLKGQVTGSQEALLSSADIVVIGGGVAGCSLLYYLTKHGQKAVLLERSQLTSGTTWHTAGLVWRVRVSDVETNIVTRTRNLMKTIEDETGVNSGWIQNGGLFIGTTKERVNEFKRLMSLGRAFGIESYVLTPNETKELYPLMRVSDITGAFYSPGDGTIDPAGYCAALSKASINSGGKVFTDCRVTGIQTIKNEFSRNAVRRVETNKGTIEAKCVVNAAGVWGRKIGKMAGVSLPLLGLKHAYVVTKRIEGIQGMPNSRDHDGSLYLKLQGDVLQIGGYEPNPVFIDDIPDDFSFGLYDLDWNVFGSHIECAVNRVPVLEETGIMSTVCGPEAFTPDHKPLVGESTECKGFYNFCGFNSMGMMVSGMASDVADSIVFGRPLTDLFSYDVRRFNKRLTDDQKWLRERSHESYAKTYSVVFPNDEPLAARNSIKGPLHQVLAERGCVYQERHGWERPGWFTEAKEDVVPLPYDYYGSYETPVHTDYPYRDHLELEYTFDFPGCHKKIGEECMSCRTNASVFDMSYFGQFYLHGPDAEQAVDWIFSNDVSKGPGSTTYTCMLNVHGGVEADLTVSCLEKPSSSAGPHCPNLDGKGYYIAAGGAAAQQSWSHIQSVLEDRKLNCSLLDMSMEMGLISLQGPASRKILSTLIDVDLSNDAFPFSTHKLVKVAGHSVRAMRLSFVGELGWELHTPNDVCVPVYEALIKAGREHGLMNAGYRAIDSLSIEKGYRHWHADLRVDDTPLESGLAFTCKLKSSTDFLGRAAVERQKADGLKKRIACFTIDEHVPIHGLEGIYRDGVPVGFVRRGDYAFYLDKSIAYGYISHPGKEPVTLDFLRNGTYELEHLGTRYKATYHQKTPFDPKNRRVRGEY